jgi:hypothetical protein
VISLRKIGGERYKADISGTGKNWRTLIGIELYIQKSKYKKDYLRKSQDMNTLDNPPWEKPGYVQDDERAMERTCYLSETKIWIQ